MKRRDFCTRITAAGVGALAMASSMTGTAQVTGPPTADVAEIYELQAAFHRAKTAQDLGLMLSLWAHNASLEIAGDPKSPYVGKERLEEFWANSGSFKNRRFSLVPSYKTLIDVRGNEASLYFECHDVADYDQPSRNIINDTFLRGTLRKVEGRWKFAQMSAGPSSPLSLDHYYP
jgi:SnoaL-like protein